MMCALVKGLIKERRMCCLLMCLVLMLDADADADELSVLATSDNLVCFCFCFSFLRSCVFLTGLLTNQNNNNNNNNDQVEEKHTLCDWNRLMNECSCAC